MSTPGELKRRARLRRTARLVGAVSLGLGAVAVAFMLGMRARYRPLLDAVRRFNRAVSNPRQMQSAGTPGAYASVTRHTGRTSGRPCATRSRRPRPTCQPATSDSTAGSASTSASGSGGSSPEEAAAR
jgi:hypothetical protein